MFSPSDGFLYIGEMLIVAVTLALLVFILTKGLRWFFQKFDVTNEEKEVTVEQFLRSLIRYVAIVAFLVYIVQPYVDLTRILMGAGIVGIVLMATLQNFIKDAFYGFIRLYEKQFVVGDFVIVNSTHYGTIAEVRLRYITIREWSGRHTMLSHSNVQEIQNYSRNELKVIEHLTIRYDQDPDTAKQVIETVCNNMNQTYSDWLQTGEYHEPVQPFQFFGLTSLQPEYVGGFQLTIIGCVRKEHYIEAHNELRYRLAKASYEEKLRLAEPLKHAAAT
ncbi:mechanosensitive ion channel family protein [Alkalihalobacillus sp. MEB130]|uniref:mechanosensitive ion channel family protein n=1 Tax=Alkalihalobacillus sp. MEB130 TaxID=2976704 RepID=UPI0028DE256C|nr:mechanosensitive ion channel family protein [Alkalihalobacillus sp. MEB130]MDT8858860.1 mechanosensitive ion channel family protein [Alkalihalobacillus sp. MEB130]